jgi:hypothetical protein
MAVWVAEVNCSHFALHTKGKGSTNKKAVRIRPNQSYPEKTKRGWGIKQGE